MKFIDGGREGIRPLIRIINISKEIKKETKEKISGYEMIIEGQRIQIKALLK